MKNIITQLRKCYVNTENLPVFNSNETIYETAVFNNEDKFKIDYIRAKDIEEAMINHKRMVIKYSKLKKDLKILRLVEFIENTQEVLKMYDNIEDDLNSKYNSIIINLKAVDPSTRKLAEIINSFCNIKLERYREPLFSGWYIIHFNLSKNEKVKLKMLKVADRKLSRAGYKTELIKNECII